MGLLLQEPPSSLYVLRLHHQLAVQAIAHLHACMFSQSECMNFELQFEKYRSGPNCQRIVESAATAYLDDAVLPFE